MKNLIALSLVCLSLNTFAADTTISTLLKVAPVGTFYGEQDDFSPCSVEVKVINGFYKTFATVSVNNGSTIVTKEVEEGSEFRSTLTNNGRIGKQTFLFFQDEKILDSNDETVYSKNFLGIKTANNGKIYVSVEESFVNNTESTIAALACSIKTK